MRSWIGCLAAALIWTPCQAAQRAEGFDAALAAAEQSGGDVAVYLHGSDWNYRGETLLRSVWETDAFARAVGDQVTLAAVDRPEAVLTPAEVEALKSAAKAAPTDQAVGAAADGGTTFTKLPEGIMLAGGTCPDRGTYAIRLRSAKPANALVIEALRHDSLPNKGPGRPSNGSWALTEVALATVDKPVPLVAAWADRSHGDMRPQQAIDGITEQGNGWAADPGDLNGERTLVLLLGSELPADSEVEARLLFGSQWAKHEIGCLRLRLARLDDARQALVKRATAAEQTRLANRKLGLDTGNYPAVFVVDKANRWVGTIDGIAAETTAAQLAKQINDLSARRIQRDQLVAQAAAAAGPAKVELLARVLELMGCSTGNFGQHNAYRPQFDELKKLDPTDTGGWVRRYEFNWGAPLDEAMKLCDDKKFDEALAVATRELANPGNRRLNTEQIQYLHLIRYRIYRRWEAQKDKQYEVLAQIVKLDPTTYLAIGCAGWLLRDQGPVSMTHGWQARHVSPGSAFWRLDSDVNRYFLWPGYAYRLSIRQNGGKNPVVIKSVALFVDGVQVAGEQRAVRLPAQNDQADFRLQVPAFKPGAKFALVVFYDAPEGTDSSGSFGTSALLPWE
ncbi:MAG: hypothetical protein HZB16_02065 [Armatimonadetes bacterium]|nr:hypothetical protein [Armatimonadota bacterium]